MYRYFLCLDKNQIRNEKEKPFVKIKDSCET